MPRRRERAKSKAKGVFHEMSNYSYDLSVESKIQDKFISGVNGGSNSVRTSAAAAAAQIVTIPRRDEDNETPPSTYIIIH